MRLVTYISLLLLPVVSYANEEEEQLPEACVTLQEMTPEQIKAKSFMEIQGLKSKCIAGDFKNSLKSAWAANTENDPVDGGCLDQLKSIDISALTFDPNSLLEGAYSAAMDQITNFSCDAVVAEINDQTGELIGELNNGLGELSDELGWGADFSIEQSSRSAADAGSLLKVEFQMSNDELQAEIDEGIWGDEVPPTPSNKRRVTNRVNSIMQNNNTRRTPGSPEAVKKQRLKLKDMFKKDEGGNN